MIAVLILQDLGRFFVDTSSVVEQNMRLPVFGGVPEWPKGADCKSAGSAFGGSNPPPSTIFIFWLKFGLKFN